MARGGSRPGSGRPKGSSNNRHNKLREILISQAEPLLEQLIILAKEGDLQALKLCIDKILPSMKPVEAPVHVSTDDTATLAERAEKVLLAALSGDISVIEANQLLSGMTPLVRIKEFDELNKRLTELEKQAEMTARLGR